MSEKKVINEDLQTESEKKKRTPRNAESILTGALSLTLPEKVDLVKKLKENINAEVDQAVNSAEEARKIVNGL